jgi:FkbM family methyltransferase
MSVPKPAHPHQPHRAKSAAARLGPVYRWARRLRALSRYLARRPHDPDFAAFRQLRGEGLFLDVGASIGQSALSFRIFNRKAPILSLEPLPSHRGDLRFVKRVLRGYRFMIAGAGAESRQAVLYVPMLGSYALPAESALNRDDASRVLERLRAEGADPARLRIDRVEVSLRRLDELSLQPFAIKIDVEGAELEVLRGARETIAACRPYLMIERSERIDAVIDLLGRDGYECFVYEQSLGRFLPYRDQEVVNVFFLPASSEALRARRPDAY